MPRRATPTPRRPAAAQRPPARRAPASRSAAARDVFLTVEQAVQHIRAGRMIIVVDDAGFASASLENLLWVTFTRSNPAVDVHGVEAQVRQKHWGCRGPLVIDARLKPHHAPPVEEDSEVSRRVDALCSSGGPLAGLGL